MTLLTKGEFAGNEMILLVVGLRLRMWVDRANHVPGEGKAAGHSL